MPLVKRTIEPVEISRNRVTSGIKNELEFITNSTLGNVIRQLSSLSKHVEDIFGELHHETCSLFNRTCQLNERIDRLKIKITQLNPTVEEVLLQDINMRKPFKSSVIKDQQIITLATRPYAVTQIYKRCEPPPALQKLNPYRHDGKDSLKFYTEPGYFFELWCQAMQKDAKSQMKRHKRVRRPQKMTAEPPKVPTNPCQENRKCLPDSDHLLDAAARYGYVQYLDGQVQQPGAIDMRKNREYVPKMPAGEPQVSDHIRSEAYIDDTQEEVVTDQYSAMSNDGTVVVADEADKKQTVEANADEKHQVDVTDAATAAAETRLLRPNSLELPTEVHTMTIPSDLEEVHAESTVASDFSSKEKSEKPKESFSPKYSRNQGAAISQVAAEAAQPAAQEPTEQAVDLPRKIELIRTVEPTRTSLPPSLTMCKATVEIPTTDKELSLLVEVVSSKHMSGAKVSSSSILGTLPPVPPPVAPPAPPPEPRLPNQRLTPDAPTEAEKPVEKLPDSNFEQNMSRFSDSSPSHSISAVENGEPETRPVEEAMWSDSLLTELTTKTSTPDSVDLPPPPSPPPPFSQMPDSLSLVSLPPLPPPPLDETDEKLEDSSIQLVPLPPLDKTLDSSCNSLPNGNIRYMPASVQPSVSSTALPQVDTISTISDSSLVTSSSGSTTRSDGGTNTVASEQPLVRDTRCDLLAAIREGIKLRKVEERRQKTEQKHLPRRLDVQTIMEAAFEMRRKVLEENDSEEEDDEFDSNWSDDD